jgi:hypothetical protein
MLGVRHAQGLVRLGFKCSTMLEVFRWGFILFPSKRLFYCDTHLSVVA